METVTIPKDEYERLIHDSEFLGCLEGAGVDNWEGYDFAIDMMKEYNCIYTDKTGIYFKDGVGGIHGEGVGYNPYGVFCGECSRLSCKSCVNKDSKDDGGEN